MNPPSATAGTAADVWEVLDRLVDDVAQMARSGAAQETFYHELLRRSVDALSALGGAYWEVRANDFARRAAYVAAGPSAGVAAAATAATSDSQHHRFLEWVVRQD